MLQLLLPVAVAILVGSAYIMAKKPAPGVMTPDRQSILDTALTSKDIDSDKLRALAKVFADNGLPLQAELLEKRAKLRELPSDVKEARKAAFRAAMESTNPAGIRVVADAFDAEGATGAAAALRTRAFDLEHPGVAAATAAPPANTGTVAQQAVALVQQQQALPIPNSPETAAAVIASMGVFNDAETARVAAMNSLLKSNLPGAPMSPETSAALQALTRVGILSGLPINEQTRVDAINALLNTSPPGTPNSPEITAAIVALTDLGVQAN
jgi:hypothetical protein